MSQFYRYWPESWCGCIWESFTTHTLLSWLQLLSFLNTWSKVSAWKVAVGMHSFENCSAFNFYCIFIFFSRAQTGLAFLWGSFLRSFSPEFAENSVLFLLVSLCLAPLSPPLQQQPSAGARLDFRSFEMVPQSEGSSSRGKVHRARLALAPASK